MSLLKFTYDVPFWILGAVCIMSIRAMKRAFWGLFFCIFASASVVVAAIVGAMEGHTTDIGFIQGGLLGVVAGVITSIQLFGLMLHGDQPLSKVALMRRVVDGKAIMGLIRPAVLKAYQWQIMGLETSNMEISDIYEYDQEPKGELSMNSIQKIPTVYYSCSDHHQTIPSCSICLQDWEEGQVGRKLERCGHTFHMICINKWFLRQVTCPICRDHLS